MKDVFLFLLTYSVEFLLAKAVRPSLMEHSIGVHRSRPYLFENNEEFELVVK